MSWMGVARAPTATDGRLVVVPGYLVPSHSASCYPHRPGSSVILTISVIVIIVVVVAVVVVVNDDGEL